MIVVVLGPEGSGKTTQAELLAKELVIPLVSTGRLVRAEIKKGTPLGERCQEVGNRGGYLRDEEINQIVIPFLERLPDKANFVLEGYPRRIGQAQRLTKFLTDLDLKLTKVIFLILAEEVIISRLTKRGRFDDTEERIRGRLRNFNQSTQEIIAYYQNLGKLIKIDGQGSVAEVFALIKKALDL